MAKRNDTYNPTPSRDPITHKTLKQQASYPAGRGTISKEDAGTSIAAKIEREQRRRENGSK